VVLGFIVNLFTMQKYFHEKRCTRVEPATGRPGENTRLRFDRYLINNEMMNRLLGIRDRDYFRKEFVKCFFSGDYPSKKDKKKD